jgi:ethanolamine utilization protein EutQ (cupin superfamily)
MAGSYDAAEQRSSRSIPPTSGWSGRGVALADVANEDESPTMKLGAVGFTKAPAGSDSQFEFEYDEVLVVTSGRCTVTSGNRALTAEPGEVVYLPANVPGTCSFTSHRRHTAPSTARSRQNCSVDRADDHRRKKGTR